MVQKHFNRTDTISATRLSKVIGGNYGLLYRDVAFLPKEILGKSSSVNFKSSPTICLEIKAKQGYLMDDCERPFGVGKCRFCYFQVGHEHSLRDSLTNPFPISVSEAQEPQNRRHFQLLSPRPFFWERRACQHSHQVITVQSAEQPKAFL